MAGDVDLRFLGEQIKRKLDALRDTIDNRFDQQTELLKSIFRTLALEIQSLKKS